MRRKEGAAQMFKICWIEEPYHWTNNKKYRKIYNKIDSFDRYIDVIRDKAFDEDLAKKELAEFFEVFQKCGPDKKLFINNRNESYYSFMERIIQLKQALLKEQYTLACYRLWELFREEPIFQERIYRPLCTLYSNHIKHNSDVTEIRRAVINMNVKANKHSCPLEGIIAYRSLIYKAQIMIENKPKEEQMLILTYIMDVISDDLYPGTMSMALANIKQPELLCPLYKTDGQFWYEIQTSQKTEVADFRLAAAFSISQMLYNIRHKNPLAE